jgi:hypothetical protein
MSSWLMTVVCKGISSRRVSERLAVTTTAFSVVLASAGAWAATIGDTVIIARTAGIVLFDFMFQTFFDFMLLDSNAGPVSGQSRSVLS